MHGLHSNANAIHFFFVFVVVVLLCDFVDRRLVKRGNFVLDVVNVCFF